MGWLIEAFRSLLGTLMVGELSRVTVQCCRHTLRGRQGVQAHPAWEADATFVRFTLCFAWSCTATTLGKQRFHRVLIRNQSHVAR